MITKYNLEKQSIEERSILDNIDKVSFRKPLYAEFVTETDELNLNYNYPSRAVIDLSKGNYFIIDPSRLDENNKEGPAIISVQFINYENVQRFEVLIVGDLGQMDYNWDVDNQDVVFPFENNDPSIDEKEDSNYNTQKIITFRLGLSVNGKQQFIGMVTPWFSSVVFVDLNITPYDSIIYGNNQCFTCPFVIDEENLNEDFLDQDLTVYPPISRDFIKEGGDLKFSVPRGFLYAIHMISPTSIRPTYSKLLSLDPIDNHLNLDFSMVNSSYPSNYFLYDIGFSWNIEAMGVIQISMTLSKGGQSFSASYTLLDDSYQNLSENSIMNNLQSSFNGNSPFGTVTIPTIIFSQEIVQWGNEPEEATGNTFIRIPFAQSYKEETGFVITNFSLVAPEADYIDPIWCSMIGDFYALDYMNINEIQE